MFSTRYSRRRFFVLPVAAATLLVVGPRMLGRAAAEESDDEALMKRFEYLSQNGNSNCSGAFMASIATMPVLARLQGSCCSPMDAHRYVEQITVLRKYAYIAEIPTDPYDILAGRAQMLMPYYDIKLNSTEQVAYDYAMKKSDEGGPCCCQCWRWHVYGGLAKYLVREHDFTGEQIVDVWDLSAGCGGGEEHRHG